MLELYEVALVLHHHRELRQFLDELIQLTRPTLRQIQKADKKVIKRAIELYKQQKCTRLIACIQEAESQIKEEKELEKKRQKIREIEERIGRKLPDPWPSAALQDPDFLNDLDVVSKQWPELVKILADLYEAGKIRFEHVDHVLRDRSFITSMRLQDRWLSFLKKLQAERPDILEKYVQQLFRLSIEDIESFIEKHGWDMLVKCLDMMARDEANGLFSCLEKIRMEEIKKVLLEAGFTEDEVKNISWTILEDLAALIREEPEMKDAVVAMARTYMQVHGHVYHIPTGKLGRMVVKLLKKYPELRQNAAMS